MRILIVDTFGESALDWALRCQDAGHQVRWFMTRTERSEPIGKGLVDKVDDWRQWIRWADLVFLTDNLKYLKQLDAWRGQGPAIVGPSWEAAQWELDRRLGMKVLERHGIEVPAYREFSDYDRAIAYVKKEGRPFVSKPCGEETDKSLSYVAKSPADLVYMLERWKKQAKLKGSFILQELVAGVEMGVGAWFGPGGFNAGFEENWEHKKLMVGDMGPNCYSADTEVLTEGGWKFWPDVGAGDRLATLVDGALTFETPSQLVSARFVGDMISWRSNRLDLLVTPGHQMYVAERADLRAGRRALKHVAAHEIAASTERKRFAMARTADWRLGVETTTPAEARLLGMFMADGYCRDRSIVFGNCPASKEEKIRRAAMDVGLVAHRYGADVYINCRRLADAYRDIPKSPEKRAPAHIVNATPRIIAAFLDGLALDATTRKGNLTYSTASAGMADDIQSLLLKIGKVGIVRRRDRRNEPDRQIKGYRILGALSWEVGVSSHALAWLRPRYCARVQYDGMVYCATVSTHILMVRRGGKPCWNGQTGEMGTAMRFVKRSKLGAKMLAPLADALEKLGYVGCVDVNCIIDAKGQPWPLEFTMRPGWPAFNIQQALHDADPAEWLLDLAEGRDTSKWRYDEIAVGVVMALPDFPYSKATQKEVVGVPIYGLKPSIMDALHPCQLMMAPAPHQVGDRVVTRPSWVSAGDYLLVATGTGTTVRQARGGAYRVLRNLKATPGSPFWRTDIGTRLKTELPALQAHGYAVGMEY